MSKVTQKAQKARKEVSVMKDVIMKEGNMLIDKQLLDDLREEAKL